MKTVSLELSKRLKEAGYPQKDSWWSWMKYKPFQIKRDKLKDEDQYFLGGEFFKGIREDYFASPTADEILDQLPQHIEGKGWVRIWTGTSGESGRGYHLGYSKILSEGGWVTIESQADSEDTLADAAAKMWLYLKENELIDNATKDTPQS